MRKDKPLLEVIFLIACAVLIPALFLLNAFQASKYVALENEIKDLEKKQIQLVEENKKLITDISILSSADRIGSIAENELGMHKAESEEIVRVQMKKNEK